MPRPRLYEGNVKERLKQSQEKYIKNKFGYKNPCVGIRYSHKWINGKCKYCDINFLTSN